MTVDTFKLLFLPFHLKLYRALVGNQEDAEDTFDNLQEAALVAESQNLNKGVDGMYQAQQEMVKFQ